MTTQLSALVAGHIDAAINEHAPGEKVRWEIGFLPMQPSPSQAPEPTVVLMVWMAGGLVNTTLGTICPILDVLGLDEATVNDMVPQILSTLREQRSQQLARSNPSINGVRPNGSGLIIP